LKVLHIGKYYFPFFGGIEKVTQDLVEDKTYQSQVESFVLAHQDQVGQESFTGEVNGVTVRKVAIQKVLVYAPIAISFLKELNRVIDDFKPDLIHIHMPNLSAFACLFSSRAKKVPWIIHWHSDVMGAVPDFKIKLLYPFYRIFERNLLKRSNKIFVTSPPYLDNSEALSDFKEKCDVVPIGIRDLCINQQHQHSQEVNRLELLMIGRLTYYKGHALILKALAKLPDELGVYLSIIGDGELRNELQAFAVELGLQNKVQFLGRVDDSEISNRLLTADLLCLPSIEKTEAFGVVLLEAAMHSKPSLVSDVNGSGMSWVVQDKITGVIFENNNVDSLCKNIQDIYFDKESLISMGVNARLRFEQVFSLDKVTIQITDLYEGALADKTMRDS